MVLWFNEYMLPSIHVHDWGSPFTRYLLDNYPELITDARVLYKGDETLITYYTITYHLSLYILSLYSYLYNIILPVPPTIKRERREEQSTGIKDRSDHKKQSHPVLLPIHTLLPDTFTLLITFVFVSCLLEGTSYYLTHVRISMIPPFVISLQSHHS
jgi:hypothetical protein